MQRWQNKRRAQVSHSEDWLITYADMITLLLCFFAIFLIVSTAKKNQVRPTPVTPIVEKIEIPSPPVVPHNSDVLDQRLPTVQPLTKAPEAFQGNLPFHDIDEDADQDTPATDPALTAPAPEAAAAVIAHPPVEVAPNANAVVAPTADLPPAPLLQSLPVADPPPAPTDLEPKGDRIKIFDINSAAFFGSGSATLSAAGADLLDQVAEELKADKFKEYQITVEGHTDDTPIHTAQFPSNWELSTARASAVVHFFLDQGIPATRLRAAGYADTFSKVPNRDASDNPIPANQALNRRVVIKLEKIEKN